jgi:hypothetical protein
VRALVAPPELMPRHEHASPWALVPPQAAPQQAARRLLGEVEAQWPAPPRLSLRSPPASPLRRQIAMGRQAPLALLRVGQPLQAGQWAQAWVQK